MLSKVCILSSFPLSIIHISCPLKRTHNKVFSFFFIFASSASIIIDAPCLLAGFAPNPLRTSFHSEPRTNKLALNAFSLERKKRGNPTSIKSRIAPNLIWPLYSVCAFQLVSPVPQSEGIYQYCTSPFGNLSSPGEPADTRHKFFSSHQVLPNIQHSTLLS